MQTTTTTTAPSARSAPKITTEKCAHSLGVKPQTMRAGLCRKGHYLGMRPLVKLPNGKLLWDAAEVERLLSGEVL